MDICYAAWSWSQREGHVFTATRDPAAALDDPARWRDYAWKWPQQRADIQAWFEAKRGEPLDLYWSPLVFDGAHRRKAYVSGGRVLYADLDPVDPRTINPKPTVAWESSMGRYHALWFVEEDLEATELGAKNKELTYRVGADKGGWDLTQVLRIPGTLNHKYDPPRPVELMWQGDDPLPIEVFRFKKGKDDGGDSPSGRTLAELIRTHRTRISRGTSERLQYPPERATKGKRSEMLWRIESELVAAKVPLEDVVEMIRLSAWNKYRGRADEADRIFAEVQKVYDSQTGAGGGAENASPPSKPEEPLFRPVPFSLLLGSAAAAPGWLVRDWWLRKSHGIVAGEPKTMKSTITLDLAMSVATGKPLWGKFPVEDQGPVVVVQNENADWIQKDRLEKLAASKGIVGRAGVVGPGRLEIRWPPEVPLYSLNNVGFSFDVTEHREALENFLTEVRPTLVIFDPLYLMFQGDVNSAKELQPALQWLMALRNELRTAVMLIHHWNKNGMSPRGGQRMLGSTTLHGWTESSAFLQQGEPGQDGESVVIVEREFRAAGNLPRLELGVRMGDHGDPFYKVDVRERDDAAADKITELLDGAKDGAMSASKLADELGIHKRRVLDMVKRRADLEVYDGPRNATMIRRKRGKR